MPLFFVFSAPFAHNNIMVWLILSLSGAIVISILSIVALATLTIKGYFDSHNGRASFEIALMTKTILKIVIFECKGNVYYQIGNRDFEKINLTSTHRQIKSTKPLTKQKEILVDLLPIPLRSFHVNLSYCADNMWSAMLKPLLEGFRGAIDYLSRGLIKCEDTSLVINDSYARQGFMLCLGVNIKVFTILVLLTKVLVLRRKTKASDSKTKA